MLSNEQLIEDVSKNVGAAYQGIYYSIFNSKSVYHYPIQGCYGNFPADWAQCTSANTKGAGVIVWIQKDYTGATEFVEYVKSDEFLLRRTLKIDVIESASKYGFVWRFEPNVPVFHLMSFMKMCRQWTEHRAGGAAFELLVRKGMKPSLAIYLCQFYRRTGDNLTGYAYNAYHGAWAHNTLNALWCVYHDAADQAVVYCDNMDLGEKPNYRGTDSWMDSTLISKGFVRPTGYRVGESLIGYVEPFIFKTKYIKGTFSESIAVIEPSVEEMIKVFEGFMEPQVEEMIKVFEGFMEPQKVVINPEDEDI